MSLNSYTAKDEETRQLFADLGLPEDASLQSIEPIAIELWQDPRTRIQAMQLVLGRYVSAKALEQERLLGGMLTIENPGQAFGGLLMYRALEEMQQRAENA